ncbi:MAG: hypothetical protein ACXABY_28350 [Candidatus Thorarchaeota archaeon]|jgi:hypothetical protein
MKKVLYFVLGFTAVWSLMMCQEVRADQWVSTGTFDPGTYLTCDLVDGVPVICAIATAEGTVREVDEIVEMLNAPPITTPEEDQAFVWYHWVNGYWIKYKLPYRYIEALSI